MVRFILQDSKATLSDGVYTYSLDTRLSNASVFALKKCSFQLTTAGTAPVAVLLRSNAIHLICGEKHTVELKANNHQSASDVIAILEESHTTGRYQLRGVLPRPIRLRYSHLRELDFYFTDLAGTNVLAGAGGGASGGDLLTAADIAVRADLWGFFDFSDTTKLTQATGTTLTGFEAVNDANQAFLSTNGTNVGWADIGTNGGKCINFSADWIRFTDSTGVTEPTSGVVSMLFRTQTTQDVYTIFHFGRFKAYGNNGMLSYDPNITNGDTTMILQNSQNYILTMILDGTKGNDEYGGLIWRLEDLGNYTVQSFNGKHHGQNTGGSYEFGGHASYSATGTQMSNFVCCQSLSAKDQAKMELYLRDVHTAQTTIRTSWDYYPMQDNMSNPTDQELTFNICRCFDTGGSGNNYGSNENLNRIYKTVTGEPMSIQFISFQVETNYEKLSVFSINADGTFDTANPIVFEATGGPNLPGSGAVLTGAAGSIGLKFQWYSDQSNNQAGWEAMLWDSSLVATGSPPGFVTVPIPANLQLDPADAEGNGGVSTTGSFVAEVDINTR